MKAKAIIEDIEDEDDEDVRDLFINALDNIRYIAHFHHQEWVTDPALTAEPLGPTTWDVTDYLMSLSPAQQRNAIEGDCATADNLIYDPAAPRWFQCWDGPFTVTVREATL